MNTLSQAASPYLKMHALDPVNWQEWSNDIFDRARMSHKPVFISIGYSSCHWCHVMQDESFKDEKLARLLNENFICVKVDREQRPDVDQLYMDAALLLGGRGGWPLNVFATPDGVPFFAGTYFPLHDTGQMAGFSTVIETINWTWRTNRRQLLESSVAVNNVMEQRINSKHGLAAANTADASVSAEQEFGDCFDKNYGGFAIAPKFAQPHVLEFLLNRYLLFGSERCLHMVDFSLLQMALGGIFDHLRGGFFRYSTDQYWRVPHFEKMLYDQALLAHVYTRGFSVTGRQQFYDTAFKTLCFVQDSFAAHAGGFYTAQNADSQKADQSAHAEGEFYLWGADELKTLLNAKQFEVFSNYFNIKDNGNVGAEFDGRNILFRSGDYELTAQQLGLDVKEVKQLCKSAVDVLKLAAQKRPAPSLDDKQLCDLNAMAVSAFAFSGRVFNNEEFTRTAVDTAWWMLDKFYAQKDLLHSVSGVDGMLDDYAYFINALCDVFLSSFDYRFLSAALECAHTMCKRFKASRGFYMSAQSATELFVRPVNTIDAAVASGNSMAVYALLRLGRLCRDNELVVMAEQVLAELEPDFSSVVRGHAFGLMAKDMANTPGIDVVICADDKKHREEFLNILRKSSDPCLSYWVLNAETLQNLPASFMALRMFLGTKAHNNKHATAYVCTQKSCLEPVLTAQQLGKVLARLRQPHAD